MLSLEVPVDEALGTLSLAVTEVPDPAFVSDTKI